MTIITKTDHPLLPLSELPSDAWDTHVHTFDPINHPYIPNSPYTPPACTVDQLVSAIPCRNFCIVMAMPEGESTALALESVAKLQAMGRNARATIVLDPSKVTSEELQRLHNGGVRSVRIHAHGHDTKALAESIEQTAAKIAPFGWSLDGQFRSAVWAELAPTILSVASRHSIKFVADHTLYLHPSELASNSEKWLTCKDMIERGILWVKLSGWDRIVKDNDLASMRQVIKAIVGINDADQVIWGSDWPHVILGDHEGKLYDIDSRAELAYLREWLSDTEWEKMLVGNPGRLYA